MPLPRGVKSPYTVYLNGVRQEPGRDYQVREGALIFPGELVKEQMTLDVRAQGFVSQTHAVVPNSNEIRLILRKRQ